jgi:LysM domain
MGLQDRTNVSSVKSDLANDEASSATSTATVQVGEQNLGQVADRLGVNKQDLLNANPQIKDPTKLSVGQDIHLPEKGRSGKTDSDDGFKGGKTTDKGSDSGAKLYGDPLAASAMKAQLDGSQGGNTKTKDLSSKDKGKDSKLSPDEQAVKNAGGDKALKGYQQFKQAAGQVDKAVHDAVVGGKMKQFDDVYKKLMDLQKNPNPSQAERDEGAKLWTKFFELQKDPDVQAELQKRERN